MPETTRRRRTRNKSCHLQPAQLTLNFWRLAAKLRHPLCPHIPRPISSPSASARAVRTSTLNLSPPPPRAQHLTQHHKWHCAHHLYHALWSKVRKTHKGRTTSRVQQPNKSSSHSNCGTLELTLTLKSTSPTSATISKTGQTETTTCQLRQLATNFRLTLRNILGIQVACG